MSPDTALSTLNLKVLSLPIEITTNHTPFLREFCDLTSALLYHANGEPPAVRFGVIRKRRYTHIEREGRTIYRLDRDYQLCPFLIEEIRVSCYDHVRDHLLLHAGVVVKNGRAILLPGQSGSGKTTLTLGLMNYGYKYLTDEVGAIHHETVEVVPFQRPIYVWTWSRPLRQEVEKDFRVYRYRDRDNATTWRWQYIVPQDGAVMSRDSRWKVDYIIFPRYTPKGKVVLRPLSAAKAVMALMQRGWNHRLFADGGLRICTELVRGARCYTLGMGDLEEACELVEGLVGKDVFRQSVTRPVSSKG
ncbi:MAG: hypothetical protein ACK4WF_07830 [Candidatus Brocadiales bacterium]